jgi:maltodextrin utilization protein YvdJ
MKDNKDPEEEKKNTEDDDENNNSNKEYFEFSFLKMKLKAAGNSQEEIRKTVIQTWWLPIASYIILALIVIFISRDLLEKLVLSLFKN